MKNKSVKVCVFQGQRLIAWTWLKWIKWFKGNTRRLKPPSCERKTCWIVQFATLPFWLVQHFLACSKSLLILSFLHVSSPLLPEMELFLFFRKVGCSIFPRSWCSLQLTSLFMQKLVICLKLLYWCYTFASFNPSAPGSD